MPRPFHGGLLGPLESELVVWGIVAVGVGLLVLAVFGVLSQRLWSAVRGRRVAEGTERDASLDPGSPEESLARVLRRRGLLGDEDLDPVEAPPRERHPSRGPNTRR